MDHPGKKTTGLLFGSFNPVHTGHLIIANHFVQHTSIEEVWFVLSPRNPFKTEKKMLGEEQRLKLLELAIEDNPAFFACDIEFSMKTPSYSIHTIKKLQQKYPDRQFVLLIGSDNLAAFDEWKDHEEIMALVNVYVYPRSQQPASHFLSHPNVSLVQAPLLEISSTKIREEFALGKRPRYLLPEKVLQCIEEKNYFQSGSQH